MKRTVRWWGIGWVAAAARRAGPAALVVAALGLAATALLAHAHRDR